jgi:outer membrane protein assembly factor BamB
VAAYDAATGAQRWSAATGCLNRQPAVDAGLVFTATWAECGSANLVFAHRAGDGSLAWSQPTDASPSEFPAAVSGGRVIVGSDSGAVFAFDEASGTPLWTARFAQYVSQAPAATPQAVLVASGRNQLAALDARSGRPLWQATLPGADAFSSNLVLANGVAYLVGSDASGNQHLLAYDARSGKRLARLADVIFGQHADLSVVDGRVYVTAAGALIVYGLQ